MPWCTEVGFISVFRERTSCLSPLWTSCSRTHWWPAYRTQFLHIFSFKLPQPLLIYSGNSPLPLATEPPPVHMGLLQVMSTGPTSSGQDPSDGFREWEYHPSEINQTLLGFYVCIRREELTCYWDWMMSTWTCLWLYSPPPLLYLPPQSNMEGAHLLQQEWAQSPKKDMQRNGCRETHTHGK